MKQKVEIFTEGYSNCVEDVINEFLEEHPNYEIHLMHITPRDGRGQRDATIVFNVKSTFFSFW